MYEMARRGKTFLELRNVILGEIMTSGSYQMDRSKCDVNLEAESSKSFQALPRWVSMAGQIPNKLSDS